MGFAYFTGVISWMFTIKTAEIAQGFAVKLVALSAGVIMISSFALGFVLFVWMMRRLQVKLTDSRALWLVPMLWVVSEYLRAIIFSIVSLGPDGRIGPYWTFGHVGYYLAATPLAFIARFGGLYLLSFTVVCLGVAIYQSWKSRRAWPLLPVLVVILGVAALGYVSYANPIGKSITVGAVRYANREGPTTESQQDYQIFASAPRHQLDVLVLPEYSHFFESTVDQDRAIIQPLMKQPDSPVIHSAREATEGLGHNMLTFHTAEGRVINQQKKWFVVPAGEYVPYIYQVVLAYAGQERLLLNFNAQKSVNRGEQIERPVSIGGVRYGSHACSGVIAPDFYNQLAQQGSDIFTNSAALDTMGISPLFHLEALQMNRLAAIAHAKPFVQSAKGGPTYILDYNGAVIRYSSASEGALIVADVQTHGGKTLYGWLGDWIVYVSLAVTIYLLAMTYRTHKGTKQGKKK